jgi:hypothetical protein
MNNLPNSKSIEVLQALSSGLFTKLGKLFK